MDDLSSLVFSAKVAAAPTANNDKHALKAMGDATSSVPLAALAAQRSSNAPVMHNGAFSSSIPPTQPRAPQYFTPTNMPMGGVGAGGAQVPMANKKGESDQPSSGELDAHTGDAFEQLLNFGTTNASNTLATGRSSTATTAAAVNLADQQRSKIPTVGMSTIPANPAPLNASTAKQPMMNALVGDAFGNLLAGTSLAKSSNDANKPLNQLRASPASSNAPSAYATPNHSTNFSPSVHQSAAQPSAQQWDFDAFLSPTASKPASNKVSNNVSPIFGGADAETDLFGGFVSANSTATPPSAKDSVALPGAGADQTTDPLGLFGAPTSVPLPQSAPSKPSAMPTVVSAPITAQSFQTPSQSNSFPITTETFSIPLSTRNQPSQGTVVAKAQEAKTQMPNESTTASTKPLPSEPSSKPNVDHMVARMVDMGFEPNESRQALAKYNLDFQAAVESLIRGEQASGGGKNGSGGSNLASRLTRLTGMSSKQAEKAGKLINTAGEMGLNFFNRAKEMVSEKLAVLENNGLGDHNQRRLGRNGGGSDNEFTFRGDSNESIEANEGFNHQAPMPFAKPATVTAAFPPQPKKKNRPVPRVAATEAQLAECDRVKEQGNETFRRGQYGDAEEAYGRAIACLPEGHLNLVPLLNNRAAARLKTGHYRECVQDCTDVENMCKPELEYEDTTQQECQEYKEAIAKALLRRATAYENMEKWAIALKDYKLTMEYSASAKGASDGIRRCTQALNRPKEAAEPPSVAAAAFATNNVSSITNDLAGFDPFVSSTPVKSAPTPTSPPKPAMADFAAAFSNPNNSTASTNNFSDFKSERVAELRAKDEQQKREDAEKFAVKDDIDAKLNLWRNGKRDNIRALLSSLETIMWAELKKDWKPVNLSELITPQQVKIRYMKAIAKLHPDKLSSMNLTAEQQLLANGIFGSLNEAWDAFKVQNQL